MTRISFHEDTELQVLFAVEALLGSAIKITPPRGMDYGGIMSNVELIHSLTTIIKITILRVSQSLQQSTEEIIVQPRAIVSIIDLHCKCLIIRNPDRKVPKVSLKGNGLYGLCSDTDFISGEEWKLTLSTNQEEEDLF